MNPDAHHPEDEPFDHAAISRNHSRGDSSANLLDHSAGPSVSDFSNNGDGFYDNAGPSKATLYDPEKPEGEFKPFEDSEYAARDRNYQDMGA